MITIQSSGVERLFNVFLFTVRVVRIWTHDLDVFDPKWSNHCAVKWSVLCRRVYILRRTHIMWCWGIRINNRRYHANKHIGLKLTCVYVLPSTATNFVVADDRTCVSFSMIYNNGMNFTKIFRLHTREIMLCASCGILARASNNVWFSSGKWPTWRTVSSIICLFEFSTCFEQLCAHLQEDNCINP
jgi:hypothetical protein